jgi:hypothetical protein
VCCCCSSSVFVKFEMPPKRWRTKNRGGGNAGSNSNNSNDIDVNNNNNNNNNNNGGGATAPIQVLQRGNNSNASNTVASPNKPNSIASPQKAPPSTVWSAGVPATISAAAAASSSSTASPTASPSSSSTNVSNTNKPASSNATNDANAAQLHARHAALQQQQLQSNQAEFLRSLSGASRSIYAPLDTAPPAGDAVTAVNVAFDVFLTEAQVRHATVLMRQKLAECTALRIREAAADARAAAESALHEQASE